MNVIEKYKWIKNELLASSSLWINDELGYLNINLISLANDRIYLLEGERSEDIGVELDIHDAILKGLHPLDITFNRVYGYNVNYKHPYLECGALTALDIYAN